MTEEQMRMLKIFIVGGTLAVMAYVLNNKVGPKTGV